MSRDIIVHVGDERQQQNGQSVNETYQHEPVRSPLTTEPVVMPSPDTSQPEGLFTELESAMDAVSCHLLTAEAIVDTSPQCDIDRVVSPSVIVLRIVPN